MRNMNLRFRILLVYVQDGFKHEVNVEKRHDSHEINMIHIACFKHEGTKFTKLRVLGVLG